VNVDYLQLTQEHVALAKDLLRENSSRWGEFFAILGGVSGKGGFLIEHYERRLREECSGAAIEDFCQHLHTYLQRRNNYVLSTLIEINQHFFSAYFRSVLKHVYEDFFEQYGEEHLKENRRRVRKNLDPLKKVAIDDDESFDLHEVISSPKVSEEDARILALFSCGPRKLWKSNQKDFLTLWMAVALKINHRYVASVLGYDKANSVAARIRNFHDKKISYSADGVERSRQLDEWLKHNFTLQFAPDSRRWLLVLHVPCDCSDPEHRFLRVELLKANGSHVPSAIVHYGNIPCKIADGRGELRLSDFHSAVKIKSGCVKVAGPGDRESEGFPVYRNENIVNVLTDDIFEKWSSRKPETLSFCVDFGPGLAWLLDRNLDYQRYGAPEKFDYADLDAVPGEALPLFAANCGITGGSLPGHGFVLPLEWRFMPGDDEPHSRLLPEPLLDLARKIVIQQKVSRNWGLHPSFRFFHDMTDFSGQTAIGATDESVASAYLTLSAALILAEAKYTVPRPIFASAQYDWQEDRMRKINLLESKMHVASDWKAEKFFVAESQQKEASDLISARSFHFSAIGCDSGEYPAFHFIEPLRPANLSPLKSVPDQEYKLHRPALLNTLSALTNANWGRKEEKDAVRDPQGADLLQDPEREEIVPPAADIAPRESIGRTERGSFVVLSGNPGMGKSILMADLYLRYKANPSHMVFGFSCNAGDKNCTDNFVKSLSWQFARHSPSFAAAALKNLHDIGPGTEIEERYRKLFYEPLIQTADKNRSRRYYILVDGLDEDASGVIARLLANPEMPFPMNYALTVSCRPVEPMLSVLKARATGILDLGVGEPAVACDKDLKKFIINYIYSDPDVRRCWQDSAYDDDELREKIAAKDKSFLYAAYVLQGIADGMYHFDSLGRELPAGLTAFYNQSFHYRFGTASQYDAVRPLLKLLLEETSVPVDEASRRLEIPVGRLVKMLHGYCVVNDNMLTLSDATLRDWLSDSIKNPDFSIF